MSYQLIQMPRYLRAYKKLHPNQRLDVDTHLAGLAADPSVGNRKRGDLSHIYVSKFKVQGQEFLLAYSIEEEIRLLYLEALAPHENFDRNLKR